MAMKLFHLHVQNSGDICLHKYYKISEEINYNNFYDCFHSRLWVLMENFDWGITYQPLFH